MCVRVKVCDWVRVAQSCFVLQTVKTHCTSTDCNHCCGHTVCVNSVHNMYNVFSSILDSVACSKYIEITWNDGHKNTLFEADIVIIAEKYSKCHVMCKELQCRMQF